MTEQLNDFEAAIAEVERRVAEGRASGRYSPELDAQLMSEFAAQRKDPLWFEALDRLPATVSRLRNLVVGPSSVEYTSSLPGGAALHKTVAKVVSRQVLALSQQLKQLFNEIATSVEDTHEALDEMRSVIRGDLLGDIDALHFRLVGVERRLTQIEAQLVESAGRPSSNEPESGE